jgi:hypothetical protein
MTRTISLVAFAAPIRITAFSGGRTRIVAICPILPRFTMLESLKYALR